MNRTYLFIGGSHDGERIAIHGCVRQLRLPEKVHDPVYSPMRKDYTVEDYRISTLRVGKSLVEFYILEGLTEERAIEMLFNKYPSGDASDIFHKPLPGHWRHSQCCLFCGTFRIAREDFDTDPERGFKMEVFNWICDKLNS